MRPYFGVGLFLIGAYFFYNAIFEDKQDKAYVEDRIKFITGGLFFMAAGIYMMLGY